MKGQNFLLVLLTTEKIMLQLLPQYAFSVLNKLTDWYKLTFYMTAYNGEIWGAHGFYYFKFNSSPFLTILV